LRINFDFLLAVAVRRGLWPGYDGVVVGDDGPPGSLASRRRLPGATESVPDVGGARRQFRASVGARRWFPDDPWSPRSPVAYPGHSTTGS